MPEIIPHVIKEDEILVRFLTKKNIKSKKPISIEFIDEQSIFFDTRGGVSMQRETYCNEIECKERASKIIDPKFIGFVIFKKVDFIQTRNDYLNSRSSFEARIFPTPLDMNFKMIISSEAFYKDCCENASHADLFYLNPAPTPDEATTNTSMRSFSRKLFKSCKVILDDNLQSTPCNFKNLFED